jgi:hypothetical protein
MPRPRPRSTAKQRGARAEPPRGAVRVVDNVRTTKPDLLVHSREPGGARVLIEVKSIAFGMSRYSIRWHLDGATWTERRAAEAVKERDAVAATIDAKVFAGACGAPAHANPDPAHGRHELRGDWRVLRAQPRRPRARGQVRRHDRQGNGEGARMAAQRGHGIPETPHTPAAGHRGMWRDFHENKTARLCPTWTPVPSTHARFALRHLLQASDARWRAEKNRAQPYTLGTQGVGVSAGGHIHIPFGGVPPPPQPGLREIADSGGDAPTRAPRSWSREGGGHT